MNLLDQKHVRMPLGRTPRKILAKKRLHIELGFEEKFGLPSDAIRAQNPRSWFRREQEAWLGEQLPRLSGLKIAMAFHVYLSDEELIVLGKLQRKMHIVSENPENVAREKYLRTLIKGLGLVIKSGADKMGISKQYALDILTKLEEALESKQHLEGLGSPKDRGQIQSRC